MIKYEQERDEAAEEFNNDVWGGEEDRCFIMSFKRGADWANARAEKKVQGLVDALIAIQLQVWSLGGDAPKSSQEIATKALAEFRGEGESD